MRLHPACWLSVLCVFAVLIQRLPLSLLAMIALLVLPAALLHYPRQVATMLRRARWLMLAIALVFIIATPGERLPGIAGGMGLTFDGFEFAALHLLRLLVMLTCLAWMLAGLGRDGLLAGLHVFLAPLANRRQLRERIMVRLMLALEFAEQGGQHSWRDWVGETEAKPHATPLTILQLSVPVVRRRDRVLLAIMAMVITVALILP